MQDILFVPGCGASAKAQGHLQRRHDLATPTVWVHFLPSPAPLPKAPREPSAGVHQRHAVQAGQEDPGCDPAACHPAAGGRGAAGAPHPPRKLCKDGQVSAQVPGRGGVGWGVGWGGGGGVGGGGGGAWGCCCTCGGTACASCPVGRVAAEHAAQLPAPFSALHVTLHKGV